MTLRVPVRDMYESHIKRYFECSKFEPELSDDRHRCWSIPYVVEKNDYGWLGNIRGKKDVLKMTYIWLSEDGVLKQTNKPTLSVDNQVYTDLLIEIRRSMHQKQFGIRW